LKQLGETYRERERETSDSDRGNLGRVDKTDNRTSDESDCRQEVYQRRALSGGSVLATYRYFERWFPE